MRFFSSATRRVAALCCMVLMAWTPQHALSQVTGDGAAALLEATQANPLLLLRQRLGQASLAASAVPFEGAVDSEEYVVGPGDAFQVSINGQDVVGSSLTVAADGRISLPDAGFIPVGGLTLAEARMAMKESLSAFYRDSETDVSLVQSRQFYVHVSGAVSVPGRHLVLPVARVSNALIYAYADTTVLPVANTSFQPSLRNIELRRSDGSMVSVDLMRYLSTGDTQTNPFLQDGDVVHVPAHNPEYNSVSVGGHIPYPGVYEFREGDTLSDLLNMAGGISEAAGVETIQVIRSGESGLTTTRFTVERVLNGGGDFLLKPLDVISIAERKQEQGLVRVEGEMAFPGTYPIVEGETTLQELIEAAGGFSDDALIRGAYLERRSLPDAADILAPERTDDPREAAFELMAADTTAIFNRLRLTDLDFVSRMYFAQELRLQNRVSVNIEAVASGSADPVELRSGDRLIVPKDDRTIFVFGQVTYPGFIRVNEGQNAEYYIAKAGGRSAQATSVLVVDPATGVPTKDLNRPLQSGDMVFVDREANLADSAELQRLIIEAERIESDRKIRRLQTIVQGIGTIASAITLIITIRKN